MLWKLKGKERIQRRRVYLFYQLLWSSSAFFSLELSHYPLTSPSLSCLPAAARARSPPARTPPAGRRPRECRGVAVGARRRLASPSAQTQAAPHCRSCAERRRTACCSLRGAAGNKPGHPYRVGRGGPWLLGSGPGAGKGLCSGLGERLWGRTRSCWKLLVLAMWLWWRNSYLAGKEGSWVVDPDLCPCLIC